MTATRNHFADLMLADMPSCTTFNSALVARHDGIRAWLNTADQVVTYMDIWATTDLLCVRLRELRKLHLLTLYVQYPLWWTGDSVLDLA